MLICHFSDWHWDFRQLPEADLYVCTGDMCSNYPIRTSQGRQRTDGTRSEWSIDPLREVALQTADVGLFVSAGGFRTLLGSPDAPVVCVRGNHDFIDLSLLFGGCNLVHEFIDNEVVEVLGLRITGHRGIPWIYGTWNDEVPRADLFERVRRMPDADLFLTHYPPLDVLDYEIMQGRRQSFGLEDMRQVLEGKMGDRGVHTFGHIHGVGGVVKELGPGSVIGGVGGRFTYSNGACHINVIEI